MTDLAGRVSTGGLFGSGGDEPYVRALNDAHDVLHLRARGTTGATLSLLPVSRYLGDASRGERRLVGELPGPVLDIGCGPGRMVAAAVSAGHRALGIDVSATAVALTAARGVPASQRSVFGDVPGAGRWGSALLLDGNVGIGGDPAALLRRCAALVSLGGWIVVEAHRDPSRDVVIEGELVDATGGISDAFPWAEAGVEALDRHAARAGLCLVRQWQLPGRRSVVAYASDD